MFARRTPSTEVAIVSSSSGISLAYTVHEELTVDGEPVSHDATEASTWVRRDGQWLCAMHSESVKGDPFGRDRVVSDGGNS